MKKHKAMFKQEAGRMISYVAFSELPSTDDSAQIKGVVEGLKDDFVKDSNARLFVATHTSSIDFDSTYSTKTTLLQQKAPGAPIDSIIRMSTGSVYGPYLDSRNGNYAIAKLLGVKTVLDSVKARHILIATQDPQSGQRVLDDSTAEKRIDSIKTAIEHGARFDSLASQLSDDRNSRVKGGDLGYFTSGRMVKAFNDFCFSGKKGERKVVKSEFGYHYALRGDEVDAARWCWLPRANFGEIGEH